MRVNSYIARQSSEEKMEIAMISSCKTPDLHIS